MDVRIEAAPMLALSAMPTSAVKVAVEKELTTSALRRVVSISRPTLGSHSLSAVAPDAFYERTLAAA